MVKLDVGNIPSNVTSYNPPSRRPVWDKANVQFIDIYTSELDSRIENLRVPDSLLCSNPQYKNQKQIEERLLCNGHYFRNN